MAADDDPREGKIAAEFLDAQFELAIVEQQGCTVNQGREDFRVRKIDAVRIALGRVEVEAERGTGHQGDAARGKFADTQLRALQVPQNADRPVELASDAPDGVEALPRSSWRWARSPASPPSAFGRSESRAWLRGLDRPGS